MNIDKEADWGTGNIIQEFHIGSIGQMNPSAKIVNNYYGVDGKPIMPKREGENPAEKKPNEQREIPPIREQIMLYVSCLTGEVAPEWQSRYMDLWNGILDLPEVAAVVYNPGKQRKTIFNRKLVGNIIYFLGNTACAEHTVYKDYNATRFAEKLEGDRDHSVRGALGAFPPKGIEDSLKRYMEDFLL